MFLTWWFYIAAIVGATLHVLIYPKRRKDGQSIVETYLVWLLALCGGVNGILAFLGHTVRAAETAASIGWPTGNPFQFEVGGANLAYGVLGILSIWFKSGFRTASVISQSVFYIVAAVGHIREVSVHSNLAPNNVGAILPDLMIPATYFLLLGIHWFFNNPNRTRSGAP